MDSEHIDATTTDDSSIQASAQPAAPRKASFERSAEVQRWLAEQQRDQAESKPPFAPTFLTNQRDSPWVLSSLSQLYEADYITDVLRVVKSGKEATVYCCAAHPRLDCELVAAKVYRPRMFRSLKNDSLYRNSRLVRDKAGAVVRGHRAAAWAASKTQRARMAHVGEWISFEYETQTRVYNAGGDVPRPFTQMGNSVLMEYVGSRDAPAPLLREVELYRDEAQPLFDRLMRNIELWLACDRIHGDLSAYNLLYWQGQVITIDFAQALDPRFNSDLYPLLLRDIDRVTRYFRRYGVDADADALASDMWLRYLQGDFLV